MKSVFYLIVASLLLTFPASPLLSQGFRNPPEGAASLGRGGAFTAISDDASAVSHNPAGLAFIEHDEIILGLTGAFPKVEFTNSTVNHNTKSGYGLLPYFFYASSLNNETISLGLGVTAPYGQSTEWGVQAVRDWAYTVPYYASMQTINVSPVASFRLSENLSAGAGINLYMSKINFNQLHPITEERMKMEIDGTAAAPSAGLLYRSEKFSMGMSYKGRFEVDYSGKMKSTTLPDMPASAQIKFPDIVALGIAYHPDQKLSLAFDVEWVGYSCLEEIPLSVGPMDDTLPRYWKDVYNFYLGTGYQYSENVKLLGGLAYVRTPVPDTTFEPSLPDADRVMLSAGGEISSKFGIFAGAVNYNIFSSRTIRGGPYEGEYQPESYLVTLEYRKNF